MCGIAGWIDKNKKILNKEIVSRRMLDSLSRRGPDQEGIYSWKDGTITLLHRRLSIIDIENGMQPMTEKYNGETYTIVYNGELYNTEELRNLLISKGFYFKTKSDTEVLLKMYIYYKEETLEKLNGIFAFAIYEEKSDKLFLARDRMGVKPLFYYYKNDVLIFASQIDTIMQSGVVKAHIDNAGLNEIFMLGPGRTPGCGIIKDVYELKRSEYAVYQDEKLGIYKYWNIKAKNHDLSLKETKEKIKYLLRDSIERQLVSDVPVATFLSGGLDSSIISKIASDYFKKKGLILTTYSINYVDNDKYFEKNLFQPNSDDEYIKIMVDYINSNHNNIVLDNEEVFHNLEEACFLRGVPGMVDIDSSLYLFCKEIKKNFSVALSGECADELFGGYPWYYNKEILFSDTFPWSQSLELRKSIINPGIIKNSDDYVNERYKKTIEQAEILSTDTEEDVKMRQMFMLNVDWFMQTLLDRKDRMSMGCGLEVRVPFCDYRLVELAYNIPSKMKLLNGREKGLLRECVKEILPQEIVERKKSPYPKTFNPIYFELVKTKILEILSDSNSYLYEMINIDAIKDYIDHSYKVTRNWYGQLMRLPQILAYLIQIEAFMKKYNVEIIK